VTDRFPPGSVGAARDFLAAYSGLPLNSVVHYATVIADGDGNLTTVITCCDDVDEATAMMRMAVAALGSGAPVTPESRSVIVSREDLRAVLHVPTGSIPADIRERFREALGLPAEAARLTPEANGD
jgi:hypothetical protein